VQSDGIQRVNREAMCVSRSARNPVTPCPSRIIAVYQRSGLNGYMQTGQVCQIWKDELDVMVSGRGGKLQDFVEGIVSNVPSSHQDSRASSDRYIALSSVPA
jgi:hypothetical protein